MLPITSNQESSNKKVSLDLKPLVEMVKDNESNDISENKNNRLEASPVSPSIPSAVDKSDIFNEEKETNNFRSKIISLLSSINKNTLNQSANSGVSKSESKKDEKPGLIDSATGMLSEYFGNKVNKVKQKVLQKVIPKSIQERIVRSNLSSAESMRNQLGLERRDPLPTPERRPGLIRRLFSRTPSVDPITTRLDLENDHPDRNRVSPNNPDHPDRNRVSPNNPDHPDRNRVSPNNPDHSPTPERRPGVTRRALNATGRGVKAVGRGVGALVMGGMSMLVPNLLPDAAMDTIDQVTSTVDTVRDVSEIARGSRTAGAAADVAGGAARGTGLLSKGLGALRVAGKIALPLAAISALVDGGMAAMDDESIQKATGKEEVSGTDRISAGAGGVLGGIAGLADMGLGMFGIETNMGESVKQGTTSGLSKAADWSKDKLSSGFEAIGNFFTGTSPDITKSVKLDDNGKAIKEPEDKGFFGKMMDWGSEKVSAITKDPISVISSIAPVAMLSNLIPDSVKTAGSDLLSKGLDISKNALSDPIGTLTKVASVSPIAAISNLIPDSIKQTGSDLLSKGLDISKNALSDPIGALTKVASVSPVGMIASLFSNDTSKETLGGLNSSLLSKDVLVEKSNELFNNQGILKNISNKETNNFSDNIIPSVYSKSLNELNKESYESKINSTMTRNTPVVIQSPAPNVVVNTPPSTTILKPPVDINSLQNFHYSFA